MTTHTIPTVDTVAWRDDAVRLIDQTLLPTEFTYIDCRTVEQVWEAIKSLRVRGAPAIGVAAAYGVVRAVWNNNAATSDALIKSLEKAADYLATSRPTAVNLFWALDRMRRVAREHVALAPDALKLRLLDEAVEIHEEDDRLCHAIGEHGATLIQDGDGVLTHCNAGGLATSGYGTALAVMFTAHAQGKRIHVYSDETRPLLQGARLTTWELMRAGIETTLICDSVAAQVMREGRIQRVVTGADRIAANGDSANKIGTYMLAVLAKAHGIPFYIAAPTSTLDMSLDNGGLIPIEERAAEEVTEGFGRRTAPEGVNVYAPAFDVTPAELITAIITEKGVHRPPYRKSFLA
ncbi:MAG: S-methyl-5-thioribose-1-phosphate isomerase [Candidatus Poribacteria bacterium]|nr:S-methyl-5-thioribose-1-phosphate isomerase [Candidatus Poribacteria bacterium]